MYIIVDFLLSKIIRDDLKLVTEWLRAKRLVRNISTYKTLNKEIHSNLPIAISQSKLVVGVVLN